jgi:hypothetical protein
VSRAFLALACVALLGCGTGVTADATPGSTPPGRPRATGITSEVPSSTFAVIAAGFLDYQDWVSTRGYQTWQKDLKAIMAKVDKINATKERWRDIQEEINEAASELDRRIDDGGDSIAKLEAIPGGVETFMADPTVPGEIANALGTKAELESAITAMKADLDGIGDMSEIGEADSLPLQRAMDRLSRTMATLSDLLKEINNTADAITQNVE